MYDKGLGIANVCQERKKSEGIYEFFACDKTALDAEGENGAGSARKVFGGFRVVGMAWEAGMTYPGNLLVFGQKPCCRKSILGMAGHSKVQGLKPLQ